jgi:hypothetical protein
MLIGDYANSPAMQRVNRSAVFSIDKTCNITTSADMRKPYRAGARAGRLILPRPGLRPFPARLNATARALDG